MLPPRSRAGAAQPPIARGSEPTSRLYPGEPQLGTPGVDWGYPRFTGGGREPMMLT
jgi:hypothetical protein